MLDFIFAVDDPVAWHEEVRSELRATSSVLRRQAVVSTCVGSACVAATAHAPARGPSATPRAQNLRRHAHHYSFLRFLGPTAMTAVAERLGAGLYFNTLVPWRPHQARASSCLPS